MGPRHSYPVVQKIPYDCDYCGPIEETCKVCRDYVHDMMCGEYSLSCDGCGLAVVYLEQDTPRTPPQTRKHKHDDDDDDDADNVKRARENSQAEISQAESDAADAGQAESDNIDASQAESDNIDASQAESDKIDASQVESDAADAGQAEISQAEISQAEISQASLDVEVGDVACSGTF